VILAAARAAVATTTTLVVPTTTTTLPPATLADLCPNPADDPCVVTKDLVIGGGGPIVDYGHRGLIIDRGKTITVVGGTLILQGGSLTLRQRAAIINPGNTLGFGLVGDFETLADSTIDISAPEAQAGQVIVLAGGNAAVGGLLRASATDAEGSGGDITITANDITVDGGITTTARRARAATFT
jgi:hypothetical protein